MKKVIKFDFTIDTSSRQFKILISIFLTVFILVVLYFSLRNSEMFLSSIFTEECVSDPMVEELKLDVERMFENRVTPWKGNLEVLNDKHKNIMKKLKMCKGTRSYTIDKKQIHICTVNEDTGEYYQKNMLMHVLLHEIAHAINDEIGHTTKFDDIFKDLMIDAHTFGIYDNNAQLLTEYCGVGAKDTYNV